MSLFVRCRWRPAPGARIVARTHEVAAALAAESSLATLAGERWVRREGSRRDALAQDVPLRALGDPETWRRARLGGGWLYRLSLWSGEDGPAGASLSLTLHDPPDDDDVLVLSDLDEDAVRAGRPPWPALLAAAASWARWLGGVCVVSSHALVEHAASLGLDGAERAAFAAFWGVDRSGTKPPRPADRVLAVGDELHLPDAVALMGAIEALGG